MNEELLEIKDPKNKKLYLMEVIQFDEDDEQFQKKLLYKLGIFQSISKVYENIDYLTKSLTILNLSNKFIIDHR